MLNMAGWQSILTIKRYAGWLLRTRAQAAPSGRIKEWSDTMQRDGVVVIPDFFTPAQIAELKADFEKFRGRFVNHFEEFSEGLVHPTNSIAPWTPPLGSELARKLFVENS